MRVGELAQSHIFLLSALLAVVFVFIVASYFFVLLMGYGFFFLTPEGLTLSAKSFYFPVMLFLLIGFYTPIQLSAGSAFAFALLIFVLCFIAAWRWRESFHVAVAKSFSRPFSGLFSNFLFAMPIISSMIYAAVLAIIYSQDFLGVPTGAPSWPEGTTLHEMFLDIAYAPLSEELGFRIIPMGLFTLFFVLLVGRKIRGSGFRFLVTSLLYPEGAKKMAGLPNVGENGIWRGISSGEWMLILATSVVFAFAHVLSGIGWEVGKATSVLVQGFFFALTYLAYGFEAPILLHWFFNYYIFFFDPDVVSKFFPTLYSLLSVVELSILALGIVGWVLFTVTGIRKLLGWRRMKLYKVAVTQIS